VEQATLMLQPLEDYLAQSRMKLSQVRLYRFYRIAHSSFDFQRATDGMLRWLQSRADFMQNSADETRSAAAAAVAAVVTSSGGGGGGGAGGSKQGYLVVNGKRRFAAVSNGTLYMRKSWKVHAHARIRCQ
jgi:hypothetical protein